MRTWWRSRRGARATVQVKRTILPCVNPSSRTPILPLRSRAVATLPGLYLSGASTTSAADRTRRSHLGSGYAKLNRWRFYCTGARREISVRRTTPSSPHPPLLLLRVVRLHLMNRTDHKFSRWRREDLCEFVETIFVNGDFLWRGKNCNPTTQVMGVLDNCQ